MHATHSLFLSFALTASILASFSLKATCSLSLFFLSERNSLSLFFSFQLSGCLPIWRFSVYNLPRLPWLPGWKARSFYPNFKNFYVLFCVASLLKRKGKSGCLIESTWEEESGSLELTSIIVSFRSSSDEIKNEARALVCFLHTCCELLLIPQLQAIVQLSEKL